jgi:precorrin-2/cobalt-factor-2 C20-methyltransferase
MSGTLFGIGVGPGDPDLITLKAHKILQAVPVIAYPAPEQGDSLARRIAAPHIPDGRREIVIRIPLDMTQSPDRSSYDRAADDIAAVLRGGEDVAIICEGDPFFYGSFMYLFDRLGADVPVQVVPGISSLMACASAALMPLVARDETLFVLPATMAEADLRARLEMAEAAAIIKLGRHAAKVIKILGDLDLLAAARYISHATLPDQRICPLSDVAPDDVPYFAMILVRRKGVGS